jgi:hypothetical protein
MNDFWNFQRQLTRRLLVWSGVSVLAGLLLQLRSGTFWPAFGQQSAAWGAIDAAIAFFGQRRADQRAAEPDAGEPQVQRQEARQLRRILWINTFLDIFYMAGGAWLIGTKGKDDEGERWRGHGWGIIIQGAFLFFFDLVHALLIDSGDEPAEQGAS